MWTARIRALTVAAVVTSGCSHVGGLVGRGVAPEGEPDLSGSIVLMRSGQYGFGLAHGCVVSQDKALTARHVAIATINGIMEFPLAYSTELGGWARTLRTYDDLDLAVMSLEGAKAGVVYKMATSPLAEGDTVWIRDFDRDEKRAMKPKTIKASILTIMPQHAILGGDWAQFGASGGCVLNIKGELVGIYTSVLFLVDGKEEGDKAKPLGVILTIPDGFKLPVDPDDKLDF